MLVSARISLAKEAMPARDCRDAGAQHMREQKAFAGAQIRPSEDRTSIWKSAAARRSGIVSRHVDRFWLRDGARQGPRLEDAVRGERQGRLRRALASVRFDPAAVEVERALLILAGARCG